MTSWIRGTGRRIYGLLWDWVWAFMQPSIKTCVKCSKTLGRSNIHGYCQTHKWASPHRQEYRKKWIVENAEAYKERKRIYSKTHKADRSRDWDKPLKSAFGLSRKDYLELLELQGGSCAICKGTEFGNSTAKRMSIDHCHTTGEVRGLLCTTCNLGLGHFKDNLVRLKEAVFYLEKFTSNNAQSSEHTGSKDTENPVLNLNNTSLVDTCAGAMVD